MTLEILISTYGKRLESLKTVLLPPMPEVAYVISCQKAAADSEQLLSDLPFLRRDDVRLCLNGTSGISANRNSSMDAAKADIVWLMDDDVRLTPEYAACVRQHFEAHPETDVACFQISTPEGLPYHDYASKPFRMKTIEDLRMVSSIEIAFRLSAVRKACVRFDERFGIGRKWPCGEEFLFLIACLRAGLSIHYYPCPVVEHSLLSTTKMRSQYEPALLEKSGAVNAILHGRTGAYVRNFLSVLKARKALKEEGVSVARFLKSKNKGTNDEWLSRPQTIKS